MTKAILFTMRKLTNTPVLKGKPLVPHSKIEKKRREVTVYRGTDCEGCPVRKKCTKTQARTITRDEREPLQEKMREKLRSEEGKRKVKGEFLLVCLAHNIGKIISKVQAIAEQERVCYQPMMAIAG